MARYVPFEMPKDHRLVYSTDPELNRRCPRCRELEVECVCRKETGEATLAGATAILSIEKKGRGGKTVTIARGLPADRELLSALTAKLKKRCGCGGTFRIDGETGVVEIQGEKREEVRSLLSGEGVRVKG